MHHLTNEHWQLIGKTLTSLSNYTDPQAVEALAGVLVLYADFDPRDAGEVARTVVLVNGRSLDLPEDDYGPLVRLAGCW